MENREYATYFLELIVRDVQKCKCELVNPINGICDHCDINGGDLVEAVMRAIADGRELMKLEIK